jgi:8-oxo-dGTP pyrophosphatase MutT (NUDIX family)
VVGDSIADLSTARNANVDFAAVLTGTTHRADFLLAELDPKWIFSSVETALTAPSDHGVVAVIGNRRNEFLLIREARPGHQYLGRWSGPHGTCKAEDILEEETVVRETREECGIEVEPVRKLCVRSADTKVSTVSFWEARLLAPEDISFDITSYEVSAIAWVALNDVISGKFPLYPGTKVFDHYRSYEVHEHNKEPE